ncbi:1-acyl-sn-glycerol-3-phosphate acyltransferase [Oceanihabitans sediminis]|uniref:Acyltransferase n=1 Tax=Oceanihabitans sediminis TaxID=1812012 RepID=A0A368P7L7_9FLAO|nr:1-acyl-sn-glycerol-3-phosphate acyltransferase [Oceanihabitans sediminis]MDX1278220.1 1-acyl-sn-glycerol-3-phosphate acyltransferase [Oceanihabitans sediminis]MDX1773725.1 1-acyl-sn-glycerol-3-phosphate acyltransferase [Oceanihabitans sediminis]RCU57789.1 acyltransferase [Oceanihabitans sediminis]
MHWLAKFIYFKILGWKMVGNTTFSKDTIKKAVFIAVPHTSWHDFYIGVLLRKTVNIKTNFVGKKELFKWPFGWYFRSVGGRALDRTPGQNKVEAIAKLFDENEEFRLTLAPEGTRKKVSEWKTGFYYIAKKANVPIIMFTMDFENKQNKISEPFYPTDDMEADFAFMHNFYKGVKGKVPEKSFDVE